MEFKGTKGKWIADIRTGCCAVYPENRIQDTNGCHFDDERNIFYSNKNAKYNGNNWEMCEESKANALLISKAPEMLEMLKVCMQTTDNSTIYKEIEQLIKEATEI